MSDPDSKVVRLVPRGAEPAPRRATSALPATFDAVLGAHLDSLYATARMLCGERSGAEDLVQTTALRAFRAWDQLRAASAVRPWLFQILRHTFLNQRRDAARRPPFVDIDLDALIEHPILGAGAALPPTGVWLTGEIADALGSLPLGFREAVWLVDVEELTIAEAAEALEVPPGTVASRVHRGRRLLRERLSGGAGGG